MKAVWRILGVCWIALLWLPLAQAGGLTDLQGKARSIDDYTGAGKWTVVMIWASDCQVCNAEAYHYVDFQTFHKDSDARVLGISIDGQSGIAAARQFIERHSINFPNLIGEPEQVAALYQNASGEQFVGTPAFLVYDPSGKLRAADIGAVPTDVLARFIADNGKH